MSTKLEIGAQYPFGEKFPQVRELSLCLKSADGKVICTGIRLAAALSYVDKTTELVSSKYPLHSSKSVFHASYLHEPETGTDDVSHHLIGEKLISKPELIPITVQKVTLCAQISYPAAENAYAVISDESSREEKELVRFKLVNPVKSPFVDLATFYKKKVKENGKEIEMWFLHVTSSMDMGLPSLESMILSRR